MRSPQRVLAGLAGALLTLGACSTTETGAGSPSPVPADEPAAETSPSSSTVPLSSTTPPTTLAVATPEDAELKAAVTAFWERYLDLGSNAGPFDPVMIRQQLEERMTGVELEQVFDFLQGNALAGYQVRGDIDSSLSVVTASASSAEVRDCYDDTTGLYDVTTGERIDSDDPERHEVVFELVTVDGVWKVKRVRDEGDGCVAAS